MAVLARLEPTQRAFDLLQRGHSHRHHRQGDVSLLVELHRFITIATAAIDVLLATRVDDLLMYLILEDSPSLLEHRSQRDVACASSRHCHC